MFCTQSDNIAESDTAAVVTSPSSSGVLFGISGRGVGSLGKVRFGTFSMTGEVTMSLTWFTGVILRNTSSTPGSPASSSTLSNGSLPSSAASGIVSNGSVSCEKEELSNISTCSFCIQASLSSQ